MKEIKKIMGQGQLGWAIWVSDRLVSKLSEGIDISSETWKARGRRSQPCKEQEEYREQHRDGWWEQLKVGGA